MPALKFRVTYLFQAALLPVARGHNISRKKQPELSLNAVQNASNSRPTRRKPGINALFKSGICLKVTLYQSEQSQGYRVLLSFLQGCRSLKVAST